MSFTVPIATVTLLFTDIEGSTRLWEVEPDAMSRALAGHDALSRQMVERHSGVVVKMVGDGVHAAFEHAGEGVSAALELQLAMANDSATAGIPLRIRCGLHSGIAERRDNDFFGATVNRAARIMRAAHGGQVLLSQATADLVQGTLPIRVSLKDLGSIRLRDVAELEHVYQVVHPELRQQFPPLASLESTPSNLPQQVTSFIGREQDIRQLTKLLSAARLVTLVGPGGIGKTRLSLEVATQLIDNYPDGAWFVDLAPIPDPALVVDAVARVLGLREDVRKPIAKTVFDYLKHRRVLLILDNCEHLIDACAPLAGDLLRGTQRAQILTTSREALRIGGETVFSVPPLGLTVCVPQGTRAGPEYSEAVQLFVDRAAAHRSSLLITERDATVLTEVCTRLDGIPLAIELAAARVRSLSLDTIAQRLDDRFRLLSIGERSALPRQQTLRALVAWSHDLLNELEKVLFRRLAVFGGGWTLEAAEEVCKGGPLEQPHVLNLLASLNEKSLVVMDGSAATQRYRMLDTIRHFAIEQLDQAPEGEVLRDRHLEFYVALAEHAERNLSGGSQTEWLAELDDELQNILVAHARCEQALSGRELDLRLMAAMRPYWLMRGLLRLGLQTTTEALKRADPSTSDAAMAGSLIALSQLAHFTGKYGEAEQYAQRGLAVARRIEHIGWTSLALSMLASIARVNADLMAARSYLEAALPLAREPGKERRLAGVLNSLAEVERAEGKLDAAIPLYEKALVLARDHQAGEFVAVILVNLSIALSLRSENERAQSLLTEAVRLIDQIGVNVVGSVALDCALILAASAGDWTEVARLYGASEAHREALSYQRESSDEVIVRRSVGAAEVALGESAFHACVTSGRCLSYQAALSEAVAWLTGRRAIPNQGIAKD